MDNGQTPAKKGRANLTGPVRTALVCVAVINIGDQAPEGCVVDNGTRRLDFR